ncbi:uncharacterized protein LOC100279047 precursor [Zea mays]|uniref:uncharacterized protein LOC100279047 precursor n=1 Tax=Zea mays TaxID=4577 RepID=UPI000220FB1C|nr:uncharacterized protein LOC100279047 precursor [Zea mays]
MRDRCNTMQASLSVMCLFIVVSCETVLANVSCRLLFYTTYVYICIISISNNMCPSS